jgi:hypothetical protein
VNNHLGESRPPPTISGFAMPASAQPRSLSRACSLEPSHHAGAQTVISEPGSHAAVPAMSGTGPEFRRLFPAWSHRKADERRRNKVQGRRLVGAILAVSGAWVCATQLSHGAVIETPEIPAIGEVTNPESGTGAAANTPVSGARLAPAWEIAPPCGDDDAMSAEPRQQCEPPTGAVGAMPRLPSDLPLALPERLLMPSVDTSAGSMSLDFARTQAIEDGLAPLSTDTAPALLDKLLAPDPSDEPDPVRSGQSDSFVEYTVPVLAAPALLVAGLLLRQLLGRRRRATLARRIKRRFGPSHRRRRTVAAGESARASGLTSHGR